MYRHCQMRLGISWFQSTQYTNIHNSSVRVNAGVNVSLSIYVSILHTDDKIFLQQTGFELW